MKRAFLLLIFLWKISVYCQSYDILQEQNLTAQIAAAAKNPAYGLQSGNTPPPLKRVPLEILTQHSDFKQFLNQQAVRNNSKTKRYNTAHRTNGSCADTSYRRLIAVNNGYLYIHSVTQISNSNILVAAIMYDSLNLPNFMGKSYPLLIKLDGDGNVRWLKKFEEDTSGTFSDLLISRAFELPNGDIIFSTALNASPVSSVYTTIVFRLTRDGNIIWKNSLRNTIGIFNSPSGSFTWRIESAAEGLNGDVILCGTSQSGLSSGIIETVVRLNNLGQPVWDANYGNHGIDGAYRFGAEGISAFVQNGQIVLVGLSLGTNNPRTAPAVNFLTLDYTNGNLLAKRFFRPDYTDKIEESGKSFSYSATNFTRLFNGNFLFSGKLFADLMNTDSIIDHFGVIEFDPAFNLVASYTISSGLKTNFYNDQLFFDASGKGLVSVFEYLDSYESNVFFGAFNNRQFQNQRKAHYINAGLPGNNGFAFVKDSGYAFIQSYFESQPATKSYFEFRKMHNSDTSSQCLGKDTMLLNFLPLHIIEDSGYYLLDDNDPDKIVASENNISQTDTTSTSSISPCKQTNYCDTVKIHGNPVICGNSSSIMFTAYKNPECGAIVQWTIDNTAIDSLKVLSDSSVRIWFKNINWHGKLYTSLSAGVCHLPAIDTLPVTVVRLQSQINLGPDTVLCNQNSIVLHAGNNFSSYLWQNGSMDSVLTVVTPGIYWVHASGFCGNNFSDSITIKPFNASISIGPDRTKCNDDTLHLSAPSNFLNYTWSNNYNINSTTSQNVIVDPNTDTAYYIKAEEKPGCFAYDTIKVQVKTSPLINMGIDKSLCEGDSALFNAGSGFEHYFWSNGSTTQQNIIKSAGTYSVIGTTADGCKSYDTVKVLNVFLTPVVSLDHNNSLCTGATRFLDAGNFSSYLWNNGSTLRKSAVNDIGVYAVEVKDNNGCAGNDTTFITKLLPTPADFLPSDTSLCSYSAMLLNSKTPYSAYLWSTGASSSSINVSQPGLYWLQVKDANDCAGKDSILVNPKDCMKGFFIPTAFTPNNDGKNDLLRPLLFGNVKKYHFTIYNRSGQVVFETTDITKGWDGNLSGIKQDTNTFVWVCSYQLGEEKAKTEKGTVVLIR